MAHLRHIAGDGTTRDVPLGPAPTAIGRGPANQLVLSHASVSWQHAVVWFEGQQLLVRDLRSTNGTFINERRVPNQSPLRDGDRLRCGDIALVVQASEDELARPLRGFVLEDLAAGSRHPLLRDRFLLGASDRCDIRVERVASPVLLLVLVDEVRVVVDDEDVPVAPGSNLVVGDRTFRLLEVSLDRVPTQPTGIESSGLRLDIALTAERGPRAELTDPDSARTFAAEGDNSATLICVLGRGWRDTAASAPDDRGWMSAAALQTALWGRGGDENRLNVLLHRVRKSLKSAGFDPWIVEKRRKYVRIRVGSVNERAS